MNAAKRLQIFQRLAEAIPEPTTELVYSSPFELLVAVVLSAQATGQRGQQGHRPVVSGSPYRRSLAGIG